MDFQTAGITGIALALVLQLVFQPIKVSEQTARTIGLPPMLCTQVDIGVPCIILESTDAPGK